MAYPEFVKSPKGNYWRGRYKDREGKYVSVRDEHGHVERFSGKREAQKAADDAEADVRKGRGRDWKAGQITFTDWASGWHAQLDLAATTMANRRRHLENHLIPFFGDMTMRQLEDDGPELILKWERQERKAGNKESSIKSWRGTLHLILEDAVGVHISVNPATRKKGRGKRSGRGSRGARSPEKVFTTPLGALLVGERMSVLTDRDDEFAMVQAMFWEALRIGECMGLEKPYVRARTLRVEWQLSDVEGETLRVPPKDDSFGDLVMPPFMRELLEGQMRRNPPVPCPCHGQPYVFRGWRPPKPVWEPSLRSLARLSGIPERTIRKVTAGEKTSEDARQRVLEAAGRFGLRQVRVPDGPACHWRQGEFRAFFTAAASGWYPAGCGGVRPVALTGEWPGTRLTGRRQMDRAEFCWAPVAPGLTPHGLRHSAKVLMEEKRIPEIMSETQMRHEVGGVSGAYRHVSPAMKAELADMMTREWTAALDARLDMSLALGQPGALSPVGVLDRALRGRLEARKIAIVPSDSPELPGNVAVLPLGNDADLHIREKRR